MTSPQNDAWIDRATMALRRHIEHLESQIARLEALRGRDGPAAEVYEKVWAVWQEDSLAIGWLVEDNRVLGEAPIDLLLRGETDQVLTLLGQIEYGTYI